MEWISYINKALDYIEDNLQGSIDYSKAAQIAKCSTYEFQRMFSYIMDISLSEYIRRRRLTLAAFDLQNSNDKIINIAMKYGYDSPAAFSRAFKCLHNATPSEARKGNKNLKAFSRMTFQITIKGNVHMNYRVEEVEAFSIVGKKYKVNTKESYKIIPKLWDNAGKDGTIKRLFSMITDEYAPYGLLGVCVNNNYCEAEDFNYYLAITNYDEPQKDMEKLEFDNGIWVIFEANGELPESLQNVWKQYYTQWLPNSGYKHRDAPDIECYFLDNKQELWVPIERIE